MEEILPIKPFRSPCKGVACIPGSKSITNRALILSAMSDSKIILRNALFSDDVNIMANALQSLGFSIDLDVAEKTIAIEGLSGKIPQKRADIFVGNAGTVARFLTSFLCLKKEGMYRLDGTSEMRDRPMKGLLDVIESMGVKVTHEKTPYHFPFSLNTKGINSKYWKVDAGDSSQILSGLLMIAPLANSRVTIEVNGETVSKPFIDMTTRMCDYFMGSKSTFKRCSLSYETITSKPYSPKDRTYKIESDATASSYFLALPVACGGYCEVNDFRENSLQGDVEFLKILHKIGLKCVSNESGARTEKIEPPIGGKFDFNDISDTFLTLAAVAPLLQSPVSITGIAHTRMQETDRIKAMATELRRLGQLVDEEHDSITVHPKPEKLLEKAQNGIEIETYEDHRIAMSFGILGSKDLLGNGKPWLFIKNPQCCSKTFPNFFDELERIRMHADS